MPAIKSRRSESEVSIRLLNHRASFSEAEEIAKSMNGRLPTLQEFVKALGDSAFNNKSKAKVFWVSGGHRLKPFNFYKVDYEKGVLEETSKDEYFALPSKQMANVVDGNSRLSISVCTDGHLIVSNLDWPNDVVQVALVDDGALALSRGREALARLKRNLPN